ncbi:MAG: energy transducer TonB [Candidatus Omnitrophica bacterium]|nr:energy transducer TonB [Candidatus Omnitrophota bacterium]
MNLRTALFISFVSHFFILTPFGNIGLIFPNKTVNEPQVNYYKSAPIEQKSSAALKAERPRQTVKQAEAPAKPETPPPPKPAATERAADKPAQKAVEQPAALNKLNVIPESIPGTTLPNTPECVSYYRYLREQIRRFLKRNYTASYEEGDVFVSFSLNKTGEIANLGIIDAKSSKDEQLRYLSFESIKNNSPFKPFPKGLPQKQISFNLPIIFKHR